MSPYPTVVMVTTAHQNASGIDLNKELSDPASAKYTALEKRTTPVTQHRGASARSGDPQAGRSGGDLAAGGDGVKTRAGGRAGYLISP